MTSKVSYRQVWLFLAILTAIIELLVLQSQVLSQPQLSPSETLLAAYQEEGTGGFSHRWVGYIIKPEGDSKDWFVELNGKRLGPYNILSQLLAISPDGEHIAFSAQKDGQWYVIVDGEDKWVYPRLAARKFSWSPDIEGKSVINEGTAIVLQFSESGEQLAYVVNEGSDNKWAVYVNESRGPVFATTGIGLNFVGEKVTYSAFDANNAIVQVFGDELHGPFATMIGAKNSWKGGYEFIEVEEQGKHFLLITGGVLVEVPGSVRELAVGSGGEVSYTYSLGEKQKIRFNGVDLPGDYDEIDNLSISPDGQHIAFWARQGENWTVVTDNSDYPGFDGHFFYLIGGEEYGILWGSDGKHLAYFAKKGDDTILALDGEEVSAPEMPGFGINDIVGDDGKSVGLMLLNGPNIDRQGFVECLRLQKEITCDPNSVRLIKGDLARIESSDTQSFMVIGDKREGPYKTIDSTLVISSDSSHYAYIVTIDDGQQAVLDGAPIGLAYEQIFRPQFIEGRGFAFIGLKDGNLYGVHLEIAG